LAFWVSSPAFSQAQIFRDFIIKANSPTNPKLKKNAFEAFGGTDRFELKEWGKGWAKSAAGSIISKGFSFNFDYENNDLYARSEADNSEIVVDKSSVLRFMIYNGADSSLFIKSIAIDPQNRTFFELIGGDPTGKVALLKHRVSKALPLNKNDYMRNFSGDYSTKYQNTTTYYILDAVKGVRSFKNLGKKELQNLYPEHLQLLNDFFKTNKHPEDRDFAALFNSMNTTL
jgi:hypothetical protein